MQTPGSKRQKRDPYRQGKKIPRQTQHNRKMSMSSSNSFQDGVLKTASAIIDSMDELDGSKDGCDLISEFQGLSGTTQADTGIVVPSGSETIGDIQWPDR